jgi:hypothetical protein
VIKRIKPSTAALPNGKKSEEVKVEHSNRLPNSGRLRENKRIFNYGYGALNPSNMMSEFSSCDFNSIDEFSLNKSNIQVRCMNFQTNNTKPTRQNLKIKRVGNQPIQGTFDYKPVLRTGRKPDEQVVHHLHESQGSCIVKDVSSFEKSIEMPSSFLEPSIVFDEKDGTAGPAIKNNVTKYKFKPIFNRERGKPSLMENKITEGVQISPKVNESESIIACSLSDINSNDLNSSERINHSPLNHEASDYYEKNNSNKDGTKPKRKLKDYITQVDQNTDLLANLGMNKSKKQMFSKSKSAHKHESKTSNKRQGHGSTGGVDSSHAISEEEALEYKKLTNEGIRGRDLVDDPALLNVEQPTEEENNFSDVHKMHMIQTLQGLLFIRSLPEVQQSEINQKKVCLPPPDHPRKDKVIVFDLDETLVHCMEEFDPTEVDHVLSIEFPNNEIVDAGLNIRPFAIECLKEANKHFQVVVFTASHS